MVSSAARRAEGPSTSAPPDAERVGVLQVCDSLAAGGLERMAVNLANGLPSDRFRSHLCATRGGGPLASAVAAHVATVDVRRRSRYDVAAIVRLASFVSSRRIRILHAHGSALFFAAAAAALVPRTRLIWHDHFGRFGLESRPEWLYRMAARRAAAVVAVTRELADWAIARLGVAADRVWYMPNFVVPGGASSPAPSLPGTPGFRVVCLANLRREKDHANLLRAFAPLAREDSRPHLLVVGSAPDPAYRAELERLASGLGLEGRVSWLGRRDDAGTVLAGSDVAVLASSSEGLPLALLEYGAAGLPTVATRVGECASVLDEGGCGLLVPAREPEALTAALRRLLGSAELRARLGGAFRERCGREYGPDAGMRRVEAVYATVLSGGVARRDA